MKRYIITDQLNPNAVNSRYGQPHRVRGVTGFAISKAP